MEPGSRGARHEEATERGVEIHAAIIPFPTPEADREALLAFCRRLAADVAPELERATGAAWRLSMEPPAPLKDDEARRPSDFLDESSLRMAEGPFDFMIAVTDAGLWARRSRLVPGLSSALSRLAIVSTRKLRMTRRGKPVRELDSDPVRWNAAALVLHLLGHLAGLKHEGAGGGAMAPFEFYEGRRAPPRFGAGASSRLEGRAASLAEREHRGAGWAGWLFFHLAMALRHPVAVARGIFASRAFLLPLALPSMATAALAPTFLLLFTTETWDVGLGLTRWGAMSYAAASLAATALYLLAAQDLLIPDKEKSIVTEHMALSNAVMTGAMLFAMASLFLLVWGVSAAMAEFVFPHALIANWRTLDHGRLATLYERFKVAGFIATIGVTTGALGGGNADRGVIRNLTLFSDEP